MRTTTEAQGIGSRLRAARHLRGMTQPQAAQKLAMSVSNYSKIEAGLRTLRDQDVAQVCILFEITREWLLGQQQDMPQSKSGGGSTAGQVASELTIDGAIRYIALQFGVDSEILRDAILRAVMRRPLGQNGEDDGHETHH
jgi:transcriptional regulator with XRE-family HTH domain